VGDRRPLPVLYEDELPFWEGARRGQLLLPHCPDCGRYWWPPGPVCPYCLSERVEWSRASGRGRVISWVVFHKQYFEAFPTPYSVVWVELEEGPRLTGNLVGCEPDRIRSGMPVEAVFEKITDEVTLVKFRPIGQNP
jgi:uncharacterized OB-fold protein